MPLRLLREGILDSDRVNRLEWAEEVFYRRLMSKVDDHGLYDARPSYLRATLYPIRAERVNDDDIIAWLAANEDAQLLVVYAYSPRSGQSRWIKAAEILDVMKGGEKPYLKMLDTRWQHRSAPKCPLPPVNGLATDNSCDQLFATAHLDVVVNEDVNDIAPRKRSARRSRSEERAIPEGWTPQPATVEAMHREFGLRVPEDVERYVVAFRDICTAKGYRYKDFDAAFRNCVRQDWPKLRGGRRPPDGGGSGKLKVDL